MKRCLFPLFILLFIVLTVPGTATYYQAEKAVRNEERTVLAERKDFTDGQGVGLKSDLADEAQVSTDRQPDLEFSIQVPKAGRYWVITQAGLDDSGKENMTNAMNSNKKSKYDSLQLGIAIDNMSPTKRVVFVPWANAATVYTERTGKFDFSGKPQKVKIWLPKGVQLDSIRVIPYTPPKVPDVAASYHPPIVPPATRPRLWVNADSLKIAQERLTHQEHKSVWEKFRGNAVKPFAFEFTPNVEVGQNAALEAAAVNKAFVYLMTKDKQQGKEAVALIRDYLSVVSFGNILDITREIGRAIYNGSLVYDWCYDLMSEQDRKSIRTNLLRLADDMEMGFPPFIGIVVNGHGNEMQLSRDLLSMAIALYGDDNVPYQYCSYRVLEELKPMLAYQYQSPFHHQGISYGPFRFECDMTAAWLFRRMSGNKVFDDNIEQVPMSWIYMRLPNGAVFPDGDGSYAPSFRTYANLLNYTYSGNPVLKGETLRQNKNVVDPMRFLLLNDPELKAETDLNVLPLTMDFGTILSGMIARTGWNISRDSKDSNDDVVIMVKGGGKHFGNHQHSDAGSFQIFFHEYLAGDMGIYGYYGTPYDMNFCKRSVSHSMMLVYDPDEVFLPSTQRSSIGNDGGARFNQKAPLTGEQTETEDHFRNGKRLAAAWGPDKHKPVFSFLSSDLTDAYSKKIKDYTRSFCFLNRQEDNIPAVLLIYDSIAVSNPAFKKYWQINTLPKPKVTPTGIQVLAGITTENEKPKGRLELSMLRPATSERTVEILTGHKEAHKVFGVSYTPPTETVQTQGSRVMFSPKKEQEHDEFLTVIQLVNRTEHELPISVTETKTNYVVFMGQHIVVLNRSKKLLDTAQTVDIPTNNDYNVLFTGLAAGQWTVKQSGSEQTYRVQADESTLYFTGKGPSTLTKTPTVIQK